MMLLLQPLPNHRYKLHRDYSYKDTTVPKGYITNGANIPRPFWSFFPPNMSDIMEAVVIHDYLCDKKEFTKADSYFRELLELTELSKSSVFILHKGVVFYHFIRYGVFKNI